MTLYLPPRLQLGEETKTAAAHGSAFLKLQKKIKDFAASLLLNSNDNEHPFCHVELSGASPPFSPHVGPFADEEQRKDSRRGGNKSKERVLETRGVLTRLLLGSALRLRAVSVHPPQDRSGWQTALRSGPGTPHRTARGHSFLARLQICPRSWLNPSLPQPQIPPVPSAVSYLIWIDLQSFWSLPTRCALGPIFCAHIRPAHQTWPGWESSLSRPVPPVSEGQPPGLGVTQWVCHTVGMLTIVVDQNPSILAFL